MPALGTEEMQLLGLDLSLLTFLFFTLHLLHSTSMTISISVKSITEILYIPDSFYYKVTNSICFYDPKEQFHKPSKALSIPSYCCLWTGVSNVISQHCQGTQDFLLCNSGRKALITLLWIHSCRQGLTHSRTSSPSPFPIYTSYVLSHRIQ